MKIITLIWSFWALTISVFAQQKVELQSPVYSTNGTKETTELDIWSQKSNSIFNGTIDRKSSLSNGTSVLDTFYTISKWNSQVYGTDIIEIDSFIYLNGQYRDWFPNEAQPGIWKPFTLKINQNGDTIWKRTDSLGIFNHLRTYSHNIIQLADGNILTLGEYDSWDSIDSYLYIKSYFIKMDTAGNTIWKKVVGLPDSLGKELWTLEAVADADTGFTAIAYTSSVGRHLTMDSSNTIPDTVFVSVVKFNKNGEVEKINRFFVGTDILRVMCSAIVKSPDGGYCLGGFNRFDTVSINYPDYNRMNYLIKVDSDINHQWTKIFGQTYSSIVTKLLLANSSDGNLLYAYPFADSTVIGGAMGQIRYGKIDNNGNTIWERRYNKVLSPNGWYTVQSRPMGIVEGPNGEIVIASQVSGFNGAFLYCADSLGNEKWSRWIPEWGEFLYNLQKSEGDGYLLTGISHGAWLVKTDSIGCVMPNCIDTLMHIGIEELMALKKQSLIVYPNPVQNTIQIAINEQGDQIQQVRVYDLNGRILLDESINAYLFTYVVSELAAGVYVVEVMGKKGNRLTSKFVKQ